MTWKNELNINKVELPIDTTQHIVGSWAGRVPYLACMD